MSASKKEKPIIEVKNLSKQYNIGVDRTYKTFCDSFTSAVRHPLKMLKESHKPNDTFWALKDVNFEVERGDVVGIIGRNGAGKSTLLKILSRITYPTEGEIKMRGRVGSLLEVGTGFHPELTGRENIYFNGAILGMKKKEIDSKFDEIVKFSGVEKFLDTPVKRYSSGMQVRLAFSVAANLDPEILVVDEVLAVGDAAFQKKCLGKMSEVAEGGRTVLFVSHNMGAVINLCSQVIWLDGGSISDIGETSKIITAYLSSFTNKSNGEVNWPTVQVAPGNDKIRIKAVRVISKGIITDEPIIDSEIVIEIDYWVLKENIIIYTSVQLRDQMGTIVFASVNWPSANLSMDSWAGKPRPRGLYRSRCVIPPNTLNDIYYTIDVGMANERNYWHEDLGGLNIMSFIGTDMGTMKQQYSGSWAGAIRPKLSWSTQCIQTLNFQHPPL